MIFDSLGLQALSFLSMELSLSPIAWIGGVLLASLAWGTWLFRKLSQWKWLDRLLIATAPTVAVLLILSAFNQFLIAFSTLQWGVKGHWSAIRLLPSFGLTHGYQLYYDFDRGPVSGMIKGPVMALAYLPATLAHSPTVAVILGSLTSAAFYFLPILGLHFAKHRKNLRIRNIIIASLAFIGFALFSCTSPALRYAAFSVNADAPALGLCAAACAVLYLRKRKESWSVLFLSATLAVLAVWAKQVAAPIAIALPIYVLLVDGRRCFVRYILCFLAAGLSVSAIFFILFKPEPLIFNMFVVPSQHPWQSSNKLLSMLQASRELIVQYSLLPLSIVVSGLLYQLLFERQKYGSVRIWLHKNPWIVFAIAGLFLMPTGLMGKAKMGGDINNFSYSLYFISAAASLLFARSCESIKFQKSELAVKTARVLLLMLFSALIFSRVFSSFSLLAKLPNNLEKAFVNLQAFPAEIAYNYAKKHSGEVYFPWHPLSHLLAENRMYHFEYGLIDRDLAGFPVSERHFRARIPTHLRFIAFHGRNDGYVLTLLPEFKKQIEIKELPGWTVYTRE